MMKPLSLLLNFSFLSSLSNEMRLVSDSSYLLCSNAILRLLNSSLSSSLFDAYYEDDELLSDSSDFAGKSPSL